MNHAPAAVCHLRLRLVAAALLVVALLIPGALAQTSNTVWEYATLTVRVSMSDGTNVWSWVTSDPDESVLGVSLADLPAELASVYGGPVPFLRMDVAMAMDVVGRAGWELVTVREVHSREAVHYFKRPAQ